MIRILFVEDEAALGKLVKEALERVPDFNITWERNGVDALKAFKEHSTDLCILDVMMPQMDGFTLAEHIRDINSEVPIIFLTARTKTVDVIKGFELGGNDYLRKPFSVEELVVRIRELLKRYTNVPSTAQNTGDVIYLGGYIYTPKTQALRHNEVIYNLSYKENELLKELVKYKNNLMERKPILLKLWGDDNFFNTRNMDVYIGRLRKYLALDKRIAIISSRGYGFKLIVTD